MPTIQRFFLTIIRGLRSLFLSIVIGAVLLVVGLWFALDGACANQIMQEVPSPDNSYKVVVFQRDCGATTGFSTYVSILKASDVLKNNARGNIMKMNGHPDSTIAEVLWNTNHSISIQSIPSPK